MDANSCSNVTDTVHFVKSGSIEDIPFTNGFKIFPNPAHDKITIMFIKPVSLEIALFDLLGKKVFEHDLLNSKEFIIPLTELSKGIYNLRIGSENIKVVKD